MVSVGGYEIQEFLMWITVSYLFLICAWIVAVVRRIEEDESWLWSSIGGAVGLVVIVVAYALPVRIGFVMFVNGVCVASLVRDIWMVVKGRGIRGSEVAVDGSAYEDEV
jgi:hypothetical protein